MARIRTIKPEFWTDEKITELSFQARLLFIGLWNLCDDWGRMEFSPKRIAFQLFPADRIPIVRFFDELKSKDLIRIYTVEGHDFLEVINFRKHQHIKTPERESQIPCAPAHTVRTEPHETAQILQEWKGMEGNGNTPPTPPRGLTGFADFWAEYPNKTGKGAAEKAWKRIAPDFDLQIAIMAGLRRSKKSLKWAEDGGRFIPHPATWLNQRRWEDEHPRTVTDPKTGIERVNPVYRDEGPLPAKPAQTEPVQNAPPQSVQTLVGQLAKSFGTMK